MIYKFKFEVCDDNQTIITAISEESGKFWAAFREYLNFVINYARHYHIDE